jgi:outer membrane protein, multidrug efflux system
MLVETGVLSRSITLLAIGLWLLVGASCKVGPSYHRPSVLDDSRNWKNQTLEDTSYVKNKNLFAINPTGGDSVKIESQWWKVFADDTLNQLIDKAFSTNPSLNIAGYRVMEARQLVNSAKANYYPIITFDPSITRNQLSGNRPSPVSTGSLPPLTLTTISVPLDMTYELDVWGKFRRNVESAKANQIATEADFQVIRLGLSADIATNYFLIRLVDSQIQLYSNALVLRRSNLKLTQDLYQAGITTQLDVNQAASEAGIVEGQLIDSKRTRALSENVIAILCGIPVMNLRIAPRTGLPSVPLIPLEVPSDLLQRRPDIVQAEQQVISATAQIGIAQAAFLPSVKLSAASAGFLSSKAENLFDKESQTWIGGVGISIPVFTGGRNTAQKGVAEARLKEIESSYRQVVLNAFREVQDAMVNIQYRTQQSDVQLKVLETARTTSSMSKELYRTGITPYINVIVADRVVLDAENTYIMLTGQRLFNSISLIKALGGGWSGGGTK